MIECKVQRQQQLCSLFILSFLITTTKGCSQISTELCLTPVGNPLYAISGDPSQTFVEVIANQDINAPFFVYYEDPGLPAPLLANPPFGPTGTVFAYRISAGDYSTIRTNITFFVSNSATGERNTSTIVTIIVEDVPNLVNFTTKMYKEENDSTFVASCLSTGNPQPNISWTFKDAAEYENLHVREAQIPDPVLVSDVSARKDLTLTAGEVIHYKNTGNYTCESENAIKNNTIVNRASNILELIVHIPIQLSSKSADKIETDVNQSNVSCTFKGYPSPNDTSWDFDKIKNYTVHGPFYDGLFTTTYLELPSVTCEDEGSLICSSTNYVLESEEKRVASGSIRIEFPAPPTPFNIKANSPPCNGTSLVVSWDYPSNIDDVLFEVTLYYGSMFVRSTTTENTQFIFSTSPATSYKVEVMSISCKSSNITDFDGTTGVIEPNEPKNVSMQKNNETQNCQIRWDEEDLAFNNSYWVYYETVNQETNQTSSKSYLAMERTTIIDTEPNTRYFVAISATNCAGESDKVEATGTCFSDTNAPDVIPQLTLYDTTTENEIPTIYQTTLTVEIPEVSQKNGIISCYYVVMVMYDRKFENFDDSDRLQLNISNQDSIADASEDISAGEFYYAVATRSPGSYIIGDENITSCNGVAKSYQAKSRKLTFGRSYDIFLATFVPSTQSQKTYSGASNGRLVNVVDPSKSGPNLVAIIVPIVIIFLLLCIGAGFFIFKHHEKQKFSKEKEDAKDSHEYESPYAEDET